MEKQQRKTSKLFLINLKKTIKISLMLSLSILLSCKENNSNSIIELNNVVIDFKISKYRDCEFSKLIFNFTLTNNSDQDILLLQNKDFNFCNLTDNEEFIKLILNDSIILNNSYKYRGDFTKLSLFHKRLVVKPNESKKVECVLGVKIFAFSLDEVNRDLKKYFESVKCLKQIRTKQKNIFYKSSEHIQVLYRLDDAFVDPKDSVEMFKSIPHELKSINH